MEYSTVKCIVVKTTAQAVDAVFEGLMCRWIPRSAIRDGENVKVKDTNLWIADWWIAEKKL